MARKMIAVLAVLVAATIPLRADEAVSKPIGTWTRTATLRNETIRLKLEVKTDTIRCTARVDDLPEVGRVTVDVEYTVTRDGRILGAVRRHRPGESRPGKGSAKEDMLAGVFVCRFKVEKETLVVSDVTWGGKNGDTMKEIVEGKYHRVEGKKTRDDKPLELAAPSQSPVDKLVIVWHNQVTIGADCVNGGERMYGLTGRVYLAGRELSEMVVADGRLVVEVYAVVPEPQQGPPARQGQWVIEKDTLNGRCLSKDVFGLGYTLNLPWPSYRPDVTRLEIRTRYEPAKGTPVYDRSLVTLGNGLGGAPVYSNRTETGDGRLIATQTRPQGPPQSGIRAPSCPTAETAPVSPPASVHPAQRMSDATLRRLGSDDKDEVIKVAILASHRVKLPDHASGVDRELAALAGKHLGELCKANEENVKVLPTTSVDRYKKEFPDWDQPLDLVKIGRDLKVRYVIYLETEALSLYLPGSGKELFQGNAEIKMSLFDMRTPDDPPDEELIRVCYPDLPTDTHDNEGTTQLRHALLNHVAERISGMFTKHPTAPTSSAK
jgi:hypothetical protein